MKSDVTLAKTLTRVCQGTYVAYEPKKAPPLPWFVYSHERGEEFFADNSNYSRLPRYRVELFFKENDPDLIERFESALDELGTWRIYDSDYVNSERCLMHDYRLAFHPNRIK